MTRVVGLFALGSLLLASCSNDVDTPAGTPPAGDAALGTPSATTPSATAVAPGDATENTTAGTAAVVDDGTVELNPANTRIGWVGTHTGDKPDPRVGSFEEFTGMAEVDPDAKTLKSVSVEIETGSLKSEIPNLTNHLNIADFFDTREYPKATFKSTRIENGDAGRSTITGDLTMHGVTKEITFPAEATISDDGLMVKAEFVIDRTEFDIGKGMDRVEKDVTITVTVNGDPSTSADAGSQPAGDSDGDANP